MKRETREVIYTKRDFACLPHTAKQDCSSSVSVHLLLKTFTFVQISLFASVLKEMLRTTTGKKKSQTHQETQMLANFHQQD